MPNETAVTYTNPNWADLQALIDAFPSALALPIGAQSHPHRLEKQIGEQWDNTLEGFSFEASAKTFIALLNDRTDDEDELQIWGKQASEAQAVPILAANSSLPYLKYGIEAGGSLHGKVTAGKQLPASLSAEGGLELGFYAYRQHNSSKQLALAIAGDTPNLRTPLRPESIRELDKGNALAMKWRGSIGLRAKVDWSSLVSSVVSKISSLNLSNGLIDVSVSANVTTEFDFALEDTYLLVFTRTEDSGQLVVEVRKDHRSERGITAGLNAQAKTSLSAKGSEKLKTLKENVGAQILGVTTPIFQQLENWAGQIQELPEELQEALQNASERLIGKPYPELLSEQKEELKQTLKTWLDELDKTVKSTAKQQFELNLLWSYRKVKTHEALIRAVIPDDYLASDKFLNLHKELRKGKLQGLQALAQSQTDGRYSSFLQRISSETISKFSFGISFGDFSFGGATTTSERFSWMENQKRELLASFLINTDRALSSGKERETLYAGATAMGIAYQAESQLKISNLDYDLTLNQTNTDRKINSDEIIEYLDTARIWGAFPSDLLSLDVAVAKLQAKHDAGKQLTFNSQLHITNEGLEKMLGTNTPDDIEIWSEALALSLHAFRWDDRLKDLDTRREAYADGARIALEHGEPTSSTLRAIKLAVCEDLESLGCDAIAKYEQQSLKMKSGRQASRRFRIGNQRYSLTALRDSLLIPLCITKKDLFENLRGLQAFARQLHVDTEAYEDRRDFEREVEKHFDLFKYLRRNRALFRALGAYITLKSLNFPKPVRQNLVKATFQVTETSPGNEETKIITFAHNETAMS
ncbi:hypothetical protein IEN85_04925 [Pelagicoccus sp. NFK12]|uniref:Uncharacterized protein n=1 Tax=Pelagicoccus enzymogenes TaxID=2773457 RepID=A0A927F5L6_9BACT|nr:hypothetical protein [Pelagicoccus enzymogenes]MBD5778824.1 hypothetical protein [Pelagicoccus enzymogenes]